MSLFPVVFRFSYYGITLSDIDYEPIVIIQVQRYRLRYTPKPFYSRPRKMPRKRRGIEYSTLNLRK